MKRFGLVTLVLVLVGCNTEVDSTPRAEQLEIAKQFATHLTQGAYAQAVEAFDAETLKAVPADSLAKTWGGLNERFGDLQSFNGVRATETGEFQILYVRGRHAHGELDVRLVFKGGTKIAGLWFRPPDKEKTYAALAISAAAAAMEPAAEGDAPTDGEGVAEGDAPSEGEATAEGAAPAEGSPTAEGGEPADGAVPGEGEAAVEGAAPAGAAPAVAEPAEGEPAAEGGAPATP